MVHRQLLKALVLTIVLLPLGQAKGSLPETEPEKMGFDRARLGLVDAAIERAIAADKVPGAVVLVARHGKIVHVSALGNRAIEPAVEPMTRDTVFDMASLTKPMATAGALMILFEQGKVQLGDRFVKYLPEFDNNGKGRVTIEQLLRHRGGFIPDNPVGDFADSPEKAWERLGSLGLKTQPDARFVYSDVGFLILGRVVEKVSGQDLDAFCKTSIYEPLAMKQTSFRRIGKADESAAVISKIAPTEKEAGTMLRGVVHDPRSRALGGVAGHAGLFSTVDDVAVYAQMLIAGGKGSDGKRILSPLTVRAMISPGNTPAHERRGLGWDIDTSYSAPRGSLFGESGFGHTGFTGTTLWVDLETETIVVLLTSRLHPKARENVNALRSEVSTLVAAAIIDASPLPVVARAELAVVKPGPASSERIRPVDCGVDVLVKQGFAQLKGKRVGLITNHSGRTKSGQSTIDALFHAPEVKLAALFSPEHGIRGIVDEPVAGGKDEATGLPIFSLYGKNKKPTPESLEGLDVLIYDIQDIGARYYTYITTLGYALEAAAEKKIPLMVLDRPNPLGGEVVSGPVRDEEFASFIAYHALPVRHGMTVGELAKLYNGERKIGAELIVLACEGWRRSARFDSTGLVWVNPSPNIRSLTEALLYPGIGLLEACDVAHGRGTDFPFERVGAPWIDPTEFAVALDALALPGVRFVPLRFTPNARQYSGKECGGVQIVVTDWSTIDPVDLGIGVATVLQAKYPGRWGGEKLIRLTANKSTCDSVLAGKTLEEVKSVWQGELDEFKKTRRKYLIYR